MPMRRSPSPHSGSAEYNVRARIGLHNSRNLACINAQDAIFELLLHVSRVEFAQVTSLFIRATITALLGILHESFLRSTRCSNSLDIRLHFFLRLLSGDVVRGLVRAP